LDEWARFGIGKGDRAEGREEGEVGYLDGGGDCWWGADCFGHFEDRIGTLSGVAMTVLFLLC